MAIIWESCQAKDPAMRLRELARILESGIPQKIRIQNKSCDQAHPLSRQMKTVHVFWGTRLSRWRLHRRLPRALPKAPICRKSGYRNPLLEFALRVPGFLIAYLCKAAFDWSGIPRTSFRIRDGGLPLEYFNYCCTVVAVVELNSLWRSVGRQWITGYR